MVSGADRMKRVNWRVVTPILILGVALVWQMIRMASKASDIWSRIIFLGLPLFTFLSGLMGLVAWLRRRKSVRTWDLMLREDPDSEHFIMFVYPTVKAQLTRLGWRLHKSAYLSVPAIGVGIGPSSVTFWEAGVTGPTLTLVASDIASVSTAPVSDGYRDHRAIQITLTTHHRANILGLNLRDVRHHTLSPKEMDSARRKCLVKVQSTGSTSS